MPSEKKKYSRRGLIVAGVGSLFVGAATASTIETEIFPTVSVSYGEVSYESGDVVVNSYEINGPGVNVDEVEVELENTSEDSISVDVDVYLMDGETVVREGNDTLSVDDGSTETANISVDRIRENEFDQIDIRVEEA